MHACMQACMCNDYMVLCSYTYTWCVGYLERHMQGGNMYGLQVQMKLIAKHFQELFLLRYMDLI